jgi:magnesium-protoporphyrin IX monomethyl ester (oxidative) cyclase
MTSQTCKAVLLNPPTAASSSEILLNLAYLSSALKKEGHEVLVLDATAPHNRLSEQEVHEKIVSYKPHFIGVTLTITYIPQTYDFIQRLRKLNIPIVAGGPHANCLPEEVLYNGCDIVSIGEGEKTIVELADYFLGKKELQDIPGICYREKKGTFQYTKPRQLIKNLDSLAFPDYGSFPISFYTGSDDPHSNPIFWSIFSSRGCPYNCIFCSSHNVFGRTYRIRSPQNVFQEISFVAEKFGARTFAFQDDEAFIDKDRIIEFCNLVKNSNHTLRFSGRLRIDSLNEDMLIAMKSAGFRRLAFGIESFNNESLKKMNKLYTIDDISRGFRILEKADIAAIEFNNLVGFPWENPKHLKRNLEEIKKIPKSILYFTSTATLIPYPGTELYDRYHKQYGFTDWWLDPDKNSPLSDPNNLKAFFLLFLFDEVPLYFEDIFWHHSKEMKKAIIDFCWKDTSLYLKRCLSFPEYLFVYGFSRISRWIWKLSPRLEHILFTPFVYIAKKLKLDKKTMFIHQQ